MNDPIHTASRQARWAQFRFSIVGSLLSAPPPGGALQKALQVLAEKSWQHPISGQPVTFSTSTVERWFYQARRTQNPVEALRSKRRVDADKPRGLSASLQQCLAQQYREHMSWSYQLHADNLAARVKENPELGPVPSYSTIRRYMHNQGFHKKRSVRRHRTPGAEAAATRLESREVRSYEVEHVHALWHLDFHHGSRKVLGKQGLWHKPLLLCIIDDHSRLVCHAQWYLDETTETLVHGFTQALQKRGLPRAVMSDNGSAMMSAEFTQGLARLSVLHQPTLPYSPYQNGKQEVLWGQVEGRLLSMLEGERELTLSLLNQATIAWVEYEYHRKFHSEIASTPLERYLKNKNVGRPCPDSAILKSSFCAQVVRKPRRSDGTFSLEGRRFEVPSAYAHLNTLCVRYARWDLGHVLLVDPHSHRCLERLYPVDKAANANARRRSLPQKKELLAETDTTRLTPTTEMAPLLKALMSEQAATGLPPAYIPKGEHQ